MNENKTKISVVVPVYNVEKYLERCVESLLAQTYKNFEIILVDDGSPDNCPKMCDEYERNCENIRVLHKENGGLSDARNKGVDIARGEYITFVDSDDFVSPLYIEMLIKGVEMGGAFSVCDFIETYDSNINYDMNKSVTPVHLVNSKEGLSEILYQRFHDVAAWGILLPKYLAKNFPFPKGKLFEDLYTTYKYYLSVDTISLVREPLYYYFQREDSIMKKRNDAFIHDLLEASDKLVEICTNESDILRRAAVSKRFSNYCRLILQPSDLETKYPNQYKHIIDTLKKERLSILVDRNVRKKNRIAAFSLYFGIFGLKFLFKLRSLLN